MKNEKWEFCSLKNLIILLEKDFFLENLFYISEKTFDGVDSILNCSYRGHLLMMSPLCYKILRPFFINFRRHKCTTPEFMDIFVIFIKKTRTSRLRNSKLNFSPSSFPLLRYTKTPIFNKFVVEYKI